MKLHWSERLARSRWLWPVIAVSFIVNDAVIAGLPILVHRMER